MPRLNRLNSMQLRELLNYDPTTGILTWRHRGRHWFKTDRSCNSFNTRCAGKAALTADSGDGYLAGTINQQTWLAHRAIWMIYFGTNPPHKLNHKNGIRTDNRIKNLRDGSGSVNSRNAKLRKDNKSGLNGVRYRQDMAKWSAEIGSRYLGIFDSFEEAASVRKEQEALLNYGPRNGENIQSNQAERN